MRKLVKNELNDLTFIESQRVFEYRHADCITRLIFNDYLNSFISKPTTMNGNGQDNPTFIGDSVYTIPGEYRRNITEFYPGKYVKTRTPPPAQFQIREDKTTQKEEKEKKTTKERDSWGKGIEFL